MVHVLRRLRVFVSSPSDVQEERKSLAKIINELNRHIAPDKGFILDLISWETHVRPGMGDDPQEVINRQIPDYDIFIGILWNRFGTPTKRAESGTEEEFNIAYERWRLKGQPEILFYFNRLPYALNGPDDIEQRKKVMEFNKKLREKGLVREYNGVDEFESLVRDHLTQLLLEKAKILSQEGTGEVDLKIGDIEVEPPKFWSSSNIVKFSLSYLGEGLAYVEELGIEIINVHPFREIKLTSPGAVPDEYRFKVNLIPKVQAYRLNKGPFVYRRNDIDMFRIKLHSPGGYQYCMRIYAKWHDKCDEKPRLLYSPSFCISFPVEDVDLAIRLTRQARNHANKASNKDEVNQNI